MRTPDETDEHTCDKCMKNPVESSEVWWRCSECDFDVCVSCEGHKKKICPFSHVLTEQANPSEEEILCDVCHKELHEVIYSCGCGFDLCSDCYN